MLHLERPQSEKLRRPHKYGMRHHCRLLSPEKSGREMLNLSLSAHGIELANWNLHSRVGFLEKADLLCST
jgi:hypothetical protein